MFDAVYDWARTQRHIPELRFVNRYHDDPGYIEALAQRRAHWRGHGRGEKLVMSFHGVPERTPASGRPLSLRITQDGAFAGRTAPTQFRPVPAHLPVALWQGQWLEPYTEPSLIALAQAGTRRVDVVCPGFTSDCLETLEEINQEAREAFLHAGGQQFEYIACLNDSAPWITALSDIAQQHLQGWPTQREDEAELKARAQRARAAGSTQ